MAPCSLIAYNHCVKYQLHIRISLSRSFKDTVLWVVLAGGIEPPSSGFSDQCSDLVSYTSIYYKSLLIRLDSNQLPSVPHTDALPK